MSNVEDFAKSRPFLAGVIGNLTAAAIWWFGGKVLAPILGAVSATTWSGLTEWLHDLGWLAFLLAVINWLLFGRKQVAYVGHVKTSQDPPMGRPTKPQATTLAPSPKPKVLSAQPIGGTVTNSEDLASFVESVIGEPALAGEIEWRVLPVSSEIVIEVKNVNTRDAPKDGISVRLDDLRKWSEETQTSVLTREFVDAPKPGMLHRTHGHKSLLFGEIQRFPFLSVGDSGGYIRVQTHTAKGESRPIPLREGPWIATVTVEWEGRSETRTVCFKSQGDRKPAVLVPCPQRKIGPN